MRDPHSQIDERFWRVCDTYKNTNIFREITKIKIKICIFENVFAQMPNGAWLAI